MVKFGAHVALTVILAVIVPLALPPSVQICPDGCEEMLTEYVDPLAYWVANLCVLLVVKVRPSPLLSCTCSVPASPVTATLSVNFVVFDVHVALTVVFAVIVPVAFVSVQL